MLADNTMRTLLNVAIYMALVAAILPWFLVALPPAAAAFLLVYAVFRHALAPPPSVCRVGRKSGAGDS